MSYLLDSHVMLWAIFDKKKLSAKVRKILENPDEEIFVSAVTFWEISLKYALGKLELDGVEPSGLSALTEEIGFAFLPLQPDVAAGYHKLNATWHRDPFDRMLIWQALHNNFTLLSKDDNVSRYTSEGLKVVW